MESLLSQAEALLFSLEIGNNPLDIFLNISFTDNNGTDLDIDGAQVVRVADSSFSGNKSLASIHISNTQFHINNTRLITT